MDIRKLVAAAAALCLCAGAVITPAYVGRVGAMAEETAGAAPEATPEAAGEIDLSEINERFHGLMEVNPHTVGWLKVNEYIDYPVVQYDNEHYLHTDFYGDKNDNGTLFVNEYNTLDPRDDVILIHGHNMKSGEMFGRLRAYENFENVCAQPIVSFRTIRDDADVLYVPVYAFHASMNPDDPEFVDIMYMNFGTEEEHQAYLDEMAGLSMWDAPVDVNIDDDLLMLVTCSYYQDNGRFMLICRKLREGETAEQMQQLYSEALK